MTTLPVRDESNVYLLDFRKMSSATKAIDLDIQFYETGLIKSINADASDKSAEVAGKILSGIAKIATMNIPSAIPMVLPQGSPLLLLPPGTPPPTLDVCTEKVMTAISEKKTKEGNLKKAQKNVRNQLDAIKKTRAAPGSTAAQLDAQMNILTQKYHALQVAQGEFDNNKAARSFTQHFEFHDNHVTKWPTGKTDKDGKPVLIDKYKYELTAKEKHYKKWLNTNLPATETNILLGKIKRKTDLYVSVGPENKGYMTKLPEDNVASKGLIYRAPVFGNVKVCVLDYCNAATSSDDILFDKALSLPGLGRIALLPFSNKAFQENNLVVNFSEAGMISQLTYKTNAPAERAASFFDATADEVVAYRKAKERKPITDLENQIAYQETLNKYKDLIKEPNAELQALELENQLRILSGKLDQMTNEELTRELARIKLQQEINELNK